MKSVTLPAFFQICVAAVLLLADCTECFPLQENKIVAKEESKKLGAELRSSPIDPAVLSAEAEVRSSTNAQSTQIEQLLRDLDTDNPDQLAAAARSVPELGKGAAARALPQLVELLGDSRLAKEPNGSRRQVRYQTIDVLVELGSTTVLETMISTLQHKNAQCQMGAAEVLGRLQEAKAVEPLVKLLGDENREVASRASTSLIEIGKPSIEPLIQGLASNSIPIRSYAAGALGKFRDPGVVRPVAQLLYDSDKLVRDFAGDALKNFANEQPLGTVWRETTDGVDTASTTIVNAEMRRLVVDELNLALKSGNLNARIEAAEAAYFLHEPELIDELAECLAVDDAALQKQCVTTLAVLLDPKSLAPLVTALRDKDSEIRAIAADGLRYQLGNRILNGPTIDALIDALDDSDDRVRIATAQALGSIESRSGKEVLPNLVKLANVDNADVATAAIRSLAQLRDPRAVQSLVAQLDRPALRRPAALALAEFGDRRAIEPLRQLLENKAPDAIRALGTLRDRESVEALIELLGDENDQVRDAAAQALGKIKDPRAVEPLIRRLEEYVARVEKRDNIMQSVTSALGEIGDPRAIGPLLNFCRRHSGMPRFEEDPLEYTRDNPMFDPAELPLFRIGAAAIEPLGAALLDSSPKVRGVAAYVLYNLAVQGGLDPQDLQPVTGNLVQALDDSSEIVRHRAAMTLGAIKDRRAVPALIEVAAASDKKYYNYGNAAAYLSQIADPSSVVPLIGLLEDQRPAVRTTAALALRGIRDPRSVEPLMRLLQDESSQVRSAAALTLSVSKDARVLQAMVTLLRDKDAGVRAAAAEGLGRFGDAQVANAVAELTRDTDSSVRIAAALALVRLHDTRGAGAVTACLAEGDAQQRERAAIAVRVAFLRDETLVAPLTKALGDPETRVRLYAAPALAHIGSQAAVDALLAKLADRESLRFVLEGLGETRDSRVFETIVPYLDDAEPEIRVAAAIALRATGDKKAIAQLVARLNDPEPPVRSAVIRALIALNATEAREPIRKFVQDEDAEVRTQVHRALVRIRHE